MEKYNINKEICLGEAYKFIKAIYPTINIGQEEFKRQIYQASNKFNIVSLAFGKIHTNNNLIILSKFNGFDDFKSIIKECLMLLDRNSDSISKFRQRDNIFNLEIVTERFHIIIQKNLYKKVEVMKVVMRQ